MIVGDRSMQEALRTRILQPFVFGREQLYIHCMIDEIRSRKGRVPRGYSDGADRCDLKESSGGLREIEAMGLMLKAWLEIQEPLSQHFFADQVPRLPDLEEIMMTLDTALACLRTVRDLHRIAVAAEDSVLVADLYRVERIVEVGIAKGREVWRPTSEAIGETLRGSAGASDDLMAYLEAHIEVPSHLSAQTRALE